MILTLLFFNNNLLCYFHSTLLRIRSVPTSHDTTFKITNKALENVWYYIVTKFRNTFVSLIYSLKINLSTVYISIFIYA